MKGAVLEPSDDGDVAQTLQKAFTEQQRHDLINTRPLALTQTCYEVAALDRVAVSHVVTEVVQPPVEMTRGVCTDDEGFNAYADLNRDGCVSLSDLAIWLSHYKRIADYSDVGG